MYKILILIVSLGSLVLSCSTVPKDSGDLKEKKDTVYLLGASCWQCWKDSANWDSYDAPDYEPSKILAEQIKNMTDSRGIQFLLFGGSWCGDSKHEMPKIYKLFKTAGYEDTYIFLYGVDRKKRERTGTAEKYDITLVPTLILLQNGHEIGRIEETPKKSWEEDLMEILIK